MNLEQLLRDVPDFPKPGILFKDISPLLASPEGLRESIKQLAKLDFGKVDKVAGIESRGFLFGTPLAIELGVGFVPIRKPGKLPWNTRSIEYDLEYGTDTIEIHEDAVPTGERVLIVDDLLATGGTMAASCALVEAIGAEVAGCAFLVELGFLQGREKLPNRKIESLVSID